MVLYLIEIMSIYINFNFDFLGLDNVYFENYFASVVQHIIAFVFKPYRTLTVRALGTGHY